MKELLVKMASAKKEIKDTKMKKEGKNEFSKYEYFTPSQVEKLVNDACFDNGLMTKFDLIRDDLGVFGVLTVFDLDNGQKLEYKMATAIPEIKATNIAQQLGGCVTYTERYLKMSAFGIVDNSLDFDTTENTQKTVEQKPQQNEDTRPWLNEKQLAGILERIAINEDGVAEKAFATFRMKKEYRDQINAQIEKFK